MTVRLQVVWPFQPARCTLDVSEVKVGASSRRKSNRSQVREVVCRGVLSPGPLCAGVCIRFGQELQQPRHLKGPTAGLGLRRFGGRSKA